MQILQLATILSLMSPAFGAATKASWLPYAGPGKYYITNEATGTSIDLLYGNPGPGTPVNGYTTVQNNPHQIWNVVTISTTNTTISIINSATGAIVYCPSPYNPGTIYNLVRAGEVPINGSSVFRLTQNSDNSATFRSVANPGLCMDLTGSNPADGTPIICYPCTGNLNQNWVLTAA